MKFPLWKYPVHMLAYGFYAGKLSKAPGTIGTLVAIPVYLLLSSYSPLSYLIIVTMLYVAGVYICGQTAKDNNAKDPGYIVFDEIVGFLVAMFMVPKTWYYILIGYIIFRGFDILKPPPIKTIEKVFSTGSAIMLDDVVAGIYTFLLLHLLVYITY